jgi:hypothetical protein
MLLFSTRCGIRASRHLQNLALARPAAAGPPAPLFMTLRHAKDASCAIPATFPAVLAGVVWHVFRLSGLRKTGVSVRRRRRTFKWVPELHALAISGHERVWGGTQMSPQGANDVRFRPDLDRLR